MTEHLEIRRSLWEDKEYLEATSPDGVTARCYVSPGTSAHSTVEEGGIVVIRADDGTLLAEAHPSH